MGTQNITVILFVNLKNNHGYKTYDGDFLMVKHLVLKGTTINIKNNTQKAKWNEQSHPFFDIPYFIETASRF